MVLMRKIELYVINLGDDFSEDDMIEQIKNSLNTVSINCMTKFGDVKEKDIGEWHDNHKFNIKYTSIEEYRGEFK